jgi:hypothetical protein
MRSPTAEVILGLYQIGVNQVKGFRYAAVAGAVAP